jgi:GTP-binding protein EngB required for normal cell division
MEIFITQHLKSKYFLKLAKILGILTHNIDTSYLIEHLYLFYIKATLLSLLGIFFDILIFHILINIYFFETYFIYDERMILVILSSMLLSWISFKIRCYLFHTIFDFKSSELIAFFIQLALFSIFYFNIVEPLETFFFQSQIKERAYKEQVMDQALKIVQFKIKENINEDAELDQDYKNFIFFLWANPHVKQEEIDFYVDQQEFQDPLLSFTINPLSLSKQRYVLNRLKSGYTLEWPHLSEQEEALLQKWFRITRDIGFQKDEFKKIGEYYRFYGYVFSILCIIIHFFYILFPISISPKLKNLMKKLDTLQSKNNHNNDLKPSPIESTDLNQDFDQKRKNQKHFKSSKEESLLIIGTSNSGKSSLIASFQQATKLKNSGLSLKVEQDLNMNEIQKIKKIVQISSIQQKVSFPSRNEFLLIQEGQNNKTLKIILDDNALNLSQLPSANRLKRKKDSLFLVKPTTCLLCIDTTRDQTEQDIILKNGFNQLFEAKKLEKCNKVIIVLTKVDQLALNAIKEMEKQIESFEDRFEEIHQRIGNKAKLQIPSCFSAKRIAQQIDPAQQALLIIPKTMAFLQGKQDDFKLYVALTSAFGFNQYEQPLFSKDLEENVPDHLKIILSDHTKLELWKPYGIVELMQLLLNHPKIDSHDLRYPQIARINKSTKLNKIPLFSNLRMSKDQHD